MLYLLFTNWVQGPYQEIQTQGFSYSPSLRGLFKKPRACISCYGKSTQLVNSLSYDPSQDDYWKWAGLHLGLAYKFKP